MQELFQQRYPDLSFLLSFFPYEKVEFSSNRHLVNTYEKWAKEISFEELEVLYVVGLSGAYLFDKWRNWLHEKKERALVFIEEELGAFEPFLKNLSFKPLLLDPQVHLHYAAQDPIEALAEQFPVDRLAVFVGEGKKFDAQRLERRSAALSALYSDVLYSHVLAENVLVHFKRLSSCFDANTWQGAFSGSAAIICGAGPSLEKSIPALKEAGQKALIFAGGSAISALSQKDVFFHLGLALDPNLEEFDRLRQSTAFERPFLFAPRLHKDVFATCSGPFGYLKSDTGGLVENFLEKALGLQGEAIGPDLGEEAFSVTTLALSIAYAFGCNPIILVGVDLAYLEGERYVSGIEHEKSLYKDPRALEKKIWEENKKGEQVETLLKWVMEKEVISSFAKAHPERLFLNCTEGGLKIEGIENVSLDKALFTHGKMEMDLEGMIHGLIQNAPLKIEEEKLKELFSALASSLVRCKELCIGLVEELEKLSSEYKENGKMLLLKSDLTEEKGYQCFLEGIEGALTHILFRYLPSLDKEKGQIDRETAKYKELILQSERFFRIFEMQGIK